ncbi:zinc finger protein 708 [Culex quinquefasciatus]|uniref:zinc finger protein 708 n=1 Tax=Culex quinquefasciatus TaxID=7176 RepID=UPI0018E3969B|nr:zinc finger protein 708 [Culex quinquefasciatus]
MTSLDTEDECFEGGTLEDFLATITFQVEEEKRHLFPRSVCPQCKELLQMFGRFRTKVRHLHLFMNALVELRDFNTAPIKELCRTKLGMVRTMLAELDLCHTVGFFAQDLIDEFPHCKIAKLPATMVQSCPGEIVQIKVEEDEPLGVEVFNALEKPEEDDIFAEECSPEELAELTKEIVADENVTSEEIMQDDVEQEQEPDQVDVEQEQEPDPDVRWECFDDSDEEVEFPNKPTKRELRALKASERKKAMEKGDMWDLLNENEPAVELTLERVGDLDAALANRKYGTAKAKEPLQCPKCPYTTIFKSNFYSHQLTHLRRENKTYPCKEPDCTKTCASLRLLQSHMESHSSVICETCGERMPTTTRLKEHVLRYHSNERITCEYCQRTFKTKCDLRNHVKNIHLSDSVFKCETCGMEFRRKTILKSHEARHRDVYNFPCQQCDKKFKIKNLLQKHIATVHNEASLECEHCFKMFHRRALLMDHIETKHKIQMRFVCDVCVAIFYTQDDLVTHKARHENPKNLECGLCLIVFPAQEQMQDHLCITYRDDYTCCKRDWRQHQQYNRHMFLKHGVKINARVKPDPHLLQGQVRAKRKRVESCSKCEAVFATRTLKKQHQETCTAELNT